MRVLTKTVENVRFMSRDYLNEQDSTVQIREMTANISVAALNEQFDVDRLDVFGYLTNNFSELVFVRPDDPFKEKLWHLVEDGIFGGLLLQNPSLQSLAEMIFTDYDLYIHDILNDQVKLLTVSLSERATGVTATYSSPV